ncbi:uncharacterized protein LOC133734652 isoform X2 [Rosa rugosa]|uniref:uncharacterized protein LOC133734652 isoform X2 n=1 Tax=Rosa rugosa TaxID=74645 RepID=UPI002B406735|nr:uncharacterized protein LOC133734652 isoform X2 [Rosa rugosa]
MKCESKQTSTTLLVQNLEPYVSDDDVRRVFEKFGSLESVQIIVTNPNTTKPHVPYKFAAMVKFSSSTEAKNALQGADGVNDWVVVRYDPDSRPLPFKLTNKHKNRLPPWLYTPRQLADLVEKNELVPPLTRPPIQATGLPENLNGLIAQRMAPARLQLNLGPVDLPHSSPPTSRTTFPAHIKVPGFFKDTLTFGTVGDILHSISSN